MVNIHCYCTHISGYQVAICPSGSTIFLGGTTFLKRCTFFAFLNLYIGLSIYGMYGMCLDKKLCEASSSQRKAQGLVLAKCKPALRKLQVASWIGIIDCPKSGYTRPNKQPRISPSKGCHRGSGASALRTEWVFSAAEEDSTTDLRRSVQRNSMEKLPLRNIALEILNMITMFSQPQKYVGSRLHHSNNYSTICLTRQTDYGWALNPWDTKICAYHLNLSGYLENRDWTASSTLCERQIQSW